MVHGVAAHVGAELARAQSRRDDILQASLLLGAAIRLLDRDGRVREQSRNAASVPAIDLTRMLAPPFARPYSAIAALAPMAHTPEDASGHFGLLTDRHGNRLRVYIESLPDSSGYLAAIIPLTYIDSTVRSFGRLMLAMALGGGIAAFGAGWIVARRALRPVTTLTNAAAAIAASHQFSLRVTEGAGGSELGRLAHTFNAMLASLQDAYEAQVRFVSAASHELRAPLTVIQANLDLLQAARMPEGDREIAIGEASVEASRMARLVGDLLVLARADAGIPFRREAVELDRIVLEVLGEARHLTRGQRLEVTDIAPSVVCGDRDRLKQLFLNVIENAIKYTPSAGHVGVAITYAGRQAVVVIRDTGMGIGPDDLPRVFERFFRGDLARSRDPGGSGLGLTIAQWVAAEHDGTIALASRPGDGTTVTICLPAVA